MKFETPINPNYACTVVRLSNIIPLPNCDNVVATTIFGFQAIVGKASQIGDIGIVFPAECQLSDDFCRFNNMYRHQDKNVDQDQKGYIEANRRVKAVKFRGNTSSCLFMPLSSLTFAGPGPEEFKEGDTFDFVAGAEICRKYELPRNLMKGPAQMAKQPSRVEQKFFPLHYDTENYYRNDRNIDPEAEVVITQKLHGTSVRIGHTVVNRALTRRDRVAKWLGVKVAPTEFSMVYGSRKVTKDINNPLASHFYKTDIHTLKGQELNGLIPEGFVVFAEIIGFTPEGGAIQVGYTYGEEHFVDEDNGPATGLGSSVWVYRVAQVNPQGMITDLSWDQVKQFCADRQLRYVPEVWRGKHKDFKVADFIEKRLFETYKGCVPLSDPKLMDEGVCVRVDGMVPKIYKAKAQSFFEHESSLIDKGVTNVEDNGQVDPV